MPISLLFNLGRPGYVYLTHVFDSFNNNAFYHQWEEIINFLFTVTFEDKRKDNFEKGRLELERRRMELQEKLKKEKDERERKEALEEERRQRAKLEAEQKRQAELEKQRQQQLEMEREQEALRKKMIQQRLVRKCWIILRFWEIAHLQCTPFLTNIVA